MHITIININLALIIVLVSQIAFTQTKNISGQIASQGEPLEYATIRLMDTPYGTTSDIEGSFYLANIPPGDYTLIVSYTGFQQQEKQIQINNSQTEFAVNFNLDPSKFILDQVVVTGTKTFKRQTHSPVIVNVIDSDALKNVQACNLSEGLRFQPGLRVETDCQTCNYTQLRMNGLGGGYSQILINGRPIFSPLTGLYGMEQIPSNMVERIEVVRGGGSALYGSNAIGGTVNVITKIPKDKSFEISQTYQSINNQTNDFIINGNFSLVNKSENLGASVFLNHRTRGMYDHNGDQFSELPEMNNSSFGANVFFQPSENQKIELSLSKLNEYRYGGEMVDKEPHFTQQSEERLHDVILGSLDYQLNFNQDNSSFILYLAGQKTDRDHYTGIYPDDQEDIENHLANPPYGISENTTYQGGLQLNHRINSFLRGSNVFTLGIEYIEDDIYDEIQAYKYQIDQVSKNLGAFLQSDWELGENLILLTGIRADKHNFVQSTIFSPRVSLLYRLKQNTQFRLTWGKGFRAPQAFDADLHIAFAGGGISRILLSPELKEERSNSVSGSINYDKATESYVAGFTLEGFYTRLEDAFYLQPIGQDALGDLFEKRNGDGSIVKGVTLEVRANYNKKIQIESGMTIQSSEFDKAIQHIDELNPIKRFLRTPDNYGYTTLSIFPTSNFSTSMNLMYTGSMQLAHFGGAPEQTTDIYVMSPKFTELSIRSSYTFDFKNKGTALELFGGVKNLTNSYQNDFDSGKNRDSNYVYGPGLPRTIFFGIRIKSL